MNLNSPRLRTIKMRANKINEMPDESHLFDSLPAYALGCLEEAEAGEVARHLAGCYLCRTELAAYQAVADQLALAAPETAAPPAALKQQLMERVQGVRPVMTARPQPVRSQRPLLARLRPVWGAVATLLIIALALTNLLLWQRLNRQELLTSGPGMQAISLNSTEVVPEARGIVIISGDGQNGVLVVDAMPKLEPEWQYQLWLSRDGEEISAAIFEVDETGYRGVRIVAPESLLVYSAVRLTIEPAEGSPQPTGEEVMNGRLPNP